MLSKGSLKLAIAAPRLVDGCAAGLLLAIVACAGSNSISANHSSPSPIEDCRGAPKVSPNTPSAGSSVKYENITVDGKHRDYRVFRPASVDISNPVAVVLVIPPPSADAALIESLIHFDSEASAAGFLAVTPNGCNSNWPYIQGGEKAADEDFIRGIIKQAKAEFSISNVFAVSASGGSRMLYRLACDLANEITAIAMSQGR